MGSIFDRLFPKNDNPFSVVDLPVKNLYEKLEAYYENNGLYEDIQSFNYQQGKFVEAMKPLRTSVNRAVEFYVSKLCQQQIEVVCENDTIKDSIEQFYKWSNFESKRRIAVRQLALFGDLFLKAVSTKTKVYAEVIEPKYITEFDVDNRGYITSIRIDIPIKEEGINLMYTEYWNKEYMAVWKHQFSESTELEDLGTPLTFMYLNQMGIDFVPFVHIKFRDTNKERGVSCVEHAIEKIDEANREATRLAQLLFRHNKPYWAIQANQVDKNNRPLPAPIINGDSNDNDSTMFYLPGNSSLTSLIPNINYADALAILQAMETEIEKDLPELRYYSLKDNELSGKALRILLAGAVDKAEEAKSNLISGLIRLNGMALTIGKFMGFFSSVGSYEAGDFEHDLDLGDIFPQDIDDRALSLKTLTDAGVPLETAMKLSGFSDEIIQEAVQSKNAQDEKALGNFLTNFNRE